MDNLLLGGSYFLVILILVHYSVAPPTKNKEPGEAKAASEDKPVNLDELGIEYNRYLKEVVNALESDPEFRKKLETAEEADFRNGKIAAELEYVNHHVRTKLDELKRTELQRLRDLVHQAEELEKNEVNPNHINPGHIDQKNPHTFESADLHKLITQVRKDLSEADRKRREDFKEYELQKKFETEQKIKAMDEEHRKKFLLELEEQKKKHAQHEPLHHPGSKAQLEEVWEKEDHMESQEFNPRTFFLLHDINGDGYWDEDEVKALFLKELDKLYQAGVPEDDMREREEEMERMREHVFKESDTNGDRLISYPEFLEQTKKQEFKKDDGWETIDTQQQFTQQEYEEFERRRQQEIQRMIDQGLLQPYAPGMMPPPLDHQGQFPQYHPGVQMQQPQQYAHNMPYPPQGAPLQYAAGHGQYAPAHPNQVPPQNNPAQYQPVQVPQQPQHYQPLPNHIDSNAIPQHPSQVNQQPQHYQAPPKYVDPNVVPQQQQASSKTPDHEVKPIQNSIPVHNVNSIPSNAGQMPENNYIPKSYDKTQQGQPSGIHSDPNKAPPHNIDSQGNKIPQGQYGTNQGAYAAQPQVQQASGGQNHHSSQKI